MHQLGSHYSNRRPWLCWTAYAPAGSSPVCLSVCLSQKLANNDVLNVSCDVTTKTNPESFGERKTSAQVNSI